MRRRRQFNDICHMQQRKKDEVIIFSREAAIWQAVVSRRAHSS
jgi:hypothetical protein